AHSLAIPSRRSSDLDLAIVLDLFVAFYLHHRSVFELETILRVFQIMLLYQHSLEGRWIEAEGGASFQALGVGISVDVLEFLVRRSEEHTSELQSREN